MQPLNLLRTQSRGCNEELLPLKWEKMAAGPFEFFRGSSLLFYHFWSSFKLPTSPLVWVCGDAHFENVGSYQAKNGIAYFDLNDFDETCLAPLHCDLGRALTGLYLSKAGHLGNHFLRVYRDSLRSGKSYHIEPEVAIGQVSVLLEKIQNRSRKKFLAEWAKHSHLRIIKNQTYRLSPAVRSRAVRLFKAWSKAQPNSEFFTIIDICGIVSGVGSIGRERYMVMVRGKKLPRLIDVKEACPSAVSRKFPGPQPKWASEAERIASVQRLMQYEPINHLGWTKARGLSYVLSEFQPTEDRIEAGYVTAEEYEDFICQWAELIAWCHLRTASWNGSSTMDALIKFAESFRNDKQAAILRASSKAAKRYRDAYRAFVDGRQSEKN